MDLGLKVRHKQNSVVWQVATALELPTCTVEAITNSEWRSTGACKVLTQQPLPCAVSMDITRWRLRQTWIWDCGIILLLYIVQWNLSIADTLGMAGLMCLD